MAFASSAYMLCITPSSLRFFTAFHIVDDRSLTLAVSINIALHRGVIQNSHLNNVMQTSTTALLYVQLLK